RRARPPLGGAGGPRGGRAPATRRPRERRSPLPSLAVVAGEGTQGARASLAHRPGGPLERAGDLLLVAGPVAVAAEERARGTAELGGHHAERPQGDLEARRGG